MERVSVRSRDLAIIGYDARSRMLEIAFRSGGVYHYSEVPQATYDALMAASSMGTYFEEHIKNQFSCQKIC